MGKVGVDGGMTWCAAAPSQQHTAQHTASSFLFPPPLSRTFSLSSFMLGMPYMSSPPTRSSRSYTVTLCPIWFRQSAAASPGFVMFFWGLREWGGEKKEWRVHAHTHTQTQTRVDEAQAREGERDEMKRQTRGLEKKQTR